MRSIRYVLAPCLLAVVFSTSAHAYSFRLEINSSGMLDGHSGYVLTSVEASNPTDDFFVFHEGGQVRFYATRPSGGAWDYFEAGTYLTPTDGAGVGTSWKYLPDDVGTPGAATLEAFTSETVPAGTFGAIQCVVRQQSDPSVTVETLHLALGVGLIREFFAGDDGVDKLASFSVVGGSGYLPLAVGNWWEYEWDVSAVGDTPVPITLLRGATPNPFNPATRIAYGLARAGQVRLAVYDLAGHHVRTLANEWRPAGPGTVTWDGSDDTGRLVAAGVYLYRLETNGVVQTRAMTLVK